MTFLCSRPMHEGASERPSDIGSLCVVKMMRSDSFPRWRICLASSEAAVVPSPRVRLASSKQILRAKQQTTYDIRQDTMGEQRRAEISQSCRALRELVHSRVTRVTCVSRLETQIQRGDVLHDLHPSMHLRRCGESIICHHSVVRATCCLSRSIRDEHA